jgi:hypothetical protein
MQDIIYPLGGVDNCPKIPDISFDKIDLVLDLLKITPLASGEIIEHPDEITIAYQSPGDA